MPAPTFIPLTTLSPRRRRLPRAPRCAVPPPQPERAERAEEEAARAPLPLARGETETLLARMLAIAVRDEDFARAASLRDSAAALLSQHPTHALRAELRAAVDAQDFARAARLRDEVARVEMHAVAERCKPRFPLGLVVVHRRLGHRMVLFGADFRCRAPGRRAEDVGVCFSRRGEEQPWYHAAVDERDKRSGDNIVYVAEDDCVPAAPGQTVQHPITRIMFRGMYEEDFCPGYSWYISAANMEGDMAEAEELGEMEEIV